MRKGRSSARGKEPSMDLIRRLGDIAPERLVGEIERLRRERDALRDSLVLKLSDHVRTLEIEPHEVLLVKKLGRLDEALTAEVLEGLCERLRLRHNWTGVIVLEDEQQDFRALTEEESLRLYAMLKERFDAA